MGETNVDNTCDDGHQFQEDFNTGYASDHSDGSASSRSPVAINLLVADNIENADGEIASDDDNGDSLV